MSPRDQRNAPRDQDQGSYRRRKYLVDSAGIPAFRVSAVGYGETQPVASNQTADGRARNRRIDVFIGAPD